MENINFGILIVDDEKIVRESLQKWFKEDGYTVDVAESAAEALKKLQIKSYDLAFVDIKMPGMDGLELQRRLKEIDKSLTVVIITAFASVESAVQALKEGAYDYVTKPIAPDELSHLVSNVVNQKKILQENIQLRQKIDERTQYDEIIGESQQIKKVFELITSVAKTDTTVLIRGESGTGKELVARVIHANSSRKYFPIIPVNCGALNDNLLESELFGHEKGAFTGAQYRRKGKFEMADGGTIFFDEIGNVSNQLQVDLLRVLETRQFIRLGSEQLINVDVRVICATNRDLELAVRERKFREDLYYRLNVFTIFLPPLRERRTDIPLLVQHFIQKFSRIMNKPIAQIDPDAMDVLVRYDWPGNIRELANAIERAMVVGKPPAIKKEDLPFQISVSNGIKPSSDSLEEIERLHILKVLNQCNWNISKAAGVLDIDRATLYNKISRYKLR
ncbi:MAG: sigma-54 dependent transcriptional regulator [Bacteroidetes bacterium]|nr:sigma-54 dependent transcriptional regulator [Bacteroidota bacterium]MBU2635785.1 sigma-54 dependent transcriptional regulator [Bacteroidota bacterium]